MGDEKDTNTEDEEWVAMPIASNTSKVVVTATNNTVTELRDLEKQRNKAEGDNLLERMQAEDTRLALARAREGMEREAQRLKEEKEKKKKKEVTTITSMSSGKWVPPHLRKQPVSQPRKKNEPFNTNDEIAFPDLIPATLEEKTKQSIPKAKKGWC